MSVLLLCVHTGDAGAAIGEILKEDTKLILL
jgi:hypothetical protein